MERINLHNISTKVYPLSRKGIRDIANKIRKDFYLSADKSIDVVKFFEFSAPFLGFDFEIVEDNEMKNNYAETDLNNNIIRIRESVFLGAGDGNPRDRFTIIHEIGHFILHKNRVLLCRSDEKIRAFENPEWQANTFAAEFLVPYEKAVALSEMEIVEIFKVSKKVAEIQKKVALDK